MVPSIVVLSMVLISDGSSENDALVGRKTRTCVKNISNSAAVDEKKVSVKRNSLVRNVI